MRGHVGAPASRVTEEHRGSAAGRGALGRVWGAMSGPPIQLVRRYWDPALGARRDVRVVCLRAAAEVPVPCRLGPDVDGRRSVDIARRPEERAGPDEGSPVEAVTVMSEVPVEAMAVEAMAVKAVVAVGAVMPVAVAPPPAAAVGLTELGPAEEHRQPEREGRTVPPHACSTARRRLHSRRVHRRRDNAARSHHLSQRREIIESGARGFRAPLEYGSMSDACS
jgi:hypothetical protein